MYTHTERVAGRPPGPTHCTLCFTYMYLLGCYTKCVFTYIATGFLWKHYYYYTLCFCIHTLAVHYIHTFARVLCTSSYSSHYGCTSKTLSYRGLVIMVDLTTTEFVSAKHSVDQSAECFCPQLSWRVSIMETVPKLSLVCVCTQTGLWESSLLYSVAVIECCVVSVLYTFISCSPSVCKYVIACLCACM